MEDRMIRLDDLFRAVKDIDLPKGLKGQVRALSDGEMKERRRYALLYSQEVVTGLEDKTSDSYRLYVAPLATTKNRELLTDAVVQIRRVEALRDAFVLYPNVLIPMPDNVTDIEEREILDQRKAQEEELVDKRVAFQDKRVATISEKLKSLNLKQLRAMAQGLAVITAERAATIDAMRWYTVYAAVSVYDNGTLERLYQDPDTVRESPQQVVDRLYLEVEEVNTVDPWEIAKNV